MHLYSGAVGLKSIQSRTAMERLTNSLVEQAVANHHVLYASECEAMDGYYEAQINAVILQNNLGGLVIRGLFNPALNKFHKLFAYPYIAGTEPHICLDAHIERQADKEAYMVHCNDMDREVSPIFFLSNITDYLNHKSKKIGPMQTVFMSALANEGHIILPVYKTEKQIAKLHDASKRRSELVDRAIQGDQDAIDRLTIGDYDTLANVCRRVVKEDIYSIVDSSFVPSGLECDAYSVVGNIREIHQARNVITDEEVYVMTLECNDVLFNLGTHKEDLVGMPQVGYRFVGKVWLQGSLLY